MLLAFVSHRRNPYLLHKVFGTFVFFDTFAGLAAVNGAARRGCGKIAADHEVVGLEDFQH